MTAILATRKPETGYGDFQALFSIDFNLEEGQAVALIGEVVISTGVEESTLGNGIPVASRQGGKTTNKPHRQQSSHSFGHVAGLP